MDWASYKNPFDGFSDAHSPTFAIFLPTLSNIHGGESQVQSPLWYVSQMIEIHTMCRLSHVVRLGNSGLKVSKIILGTMQYGTSKWQEWVLGEEEAIKHIKFAYVLCCL